MYTTDSNIFLHEHLPESDSIRLLIIHPGQYKSVIQCDIIHTTLHACHSDIYENYTALSYVWGNATGTTDIWINGFRFPVTVNLAKALDGLRDEKRPLRVWADAVCINQINVSGRSHQVGLMKEIYGLAQQTVIDLGPLTEETKRLFEIMQEKKPDHVKLKIASFDAARDILSRPWFTRVWVYQELVLSAGVLVQIGHMRVPWDSLCDIILSHLGDGTSNNDTSDRELNSQDTVTPPYRSTDAVDLDADKIPLKLMPRPFVPWPEQCEFDTQRHKLLWGMNNMNEDRLKYHLELWGGGCRVSLLDILVSRRGSKASDLRDIIYGYLAIANLENDPLTSEMFPEVYNWEPSKYIPVADYTKSAEEVFTEAACYIACYDTPCGLRSGLRQVLHYAATKAPHIKSSNLPSWVPDWTLDISSLQDPCWASDNDTMDAFNATLPAGFKHVAGFIPVYPHILSFFYLQNCYKLEIVERTNDLVVNELPNEHAKQALNDSVSQELKRVYSSTWNEEEFSYIYQAAHYLWQSLQANNMWPDPSEDFSCLLRTWERILKFDRVRTRATYANGTLFEKVVRMVMRYGISKDLSSGMTFARFRSGRIGIVPTGTKQGDVMLDLSSSEEQHQDSGYVFRPKEGYGIKDYDRGIRAAINHPYRDEISILHCTYAGRGWVDETPNNNGFDKFPRDRTNLSIIAIH